MAKNRVFRYRISLEPRTEDEIILCETLNNLGNKKNEIIMDALREKYNLPKVDVLLDKMFDRGYKASSLIKKDDNEYVSDDKPKKIKRMQKKSSEKTVINNLEINKKEHEISKVSLNNDDKEVEETVPEEINIDTNEKDNSSKDDGNMILKKVKKKNINKETLDIFLNSLSEF